jgi:prefoldin alpha subunit
MKEDQLELQMLIQQITQMQQQLEELEKQIMEVNNIQSSLEDLKKVKPGTEIEVPIANGIFAKAEIKNNKTLKVNVGSGVIVTKTIDETKALLEGQIKNIINYREQIMAEMQKIYKKLQ